MPKSSIKTVKDFAEHKFKEKGSVFIAQVYPVSSTDEPEKILDTVRKHYYDATHHCYAYKLLNSKVKYSDDGEPAGTAGVRILNAIEHFDLENVIVVVIRYFGGTKLGVGPLGKAYYQSALEVLEKVEKPVKKIVEKIKIRYDYEHTNKVHHLISKYGAVNITNGFENKPVLECMIDPGKIDNFINELSDATSNKVEIEKSDEHFLI